MIDQWSTRWTAITKDLHTVSYEVKPSILNPLALFCKPCIAKREEIIKEAHSLKRHTHCKCARASSPLNKRNHID